MGSLIDEQLSRVPQKTERVQRVYHDFARVDALQASRTERLNRALTWNLLGASPAEAAAYEGFEDAPLPDYVEEEDPVVEPTSTPATDEERAAIQRVFFPTVTRGNLALAPEVTTREAPVWGARLAAPPTTEEDRHALSLSFIERVYDPSQKRIQLATQRFLKGQADRVSAALAKVTLPDTKTLSLEDDIVGAIFDVKAEDEAMSEAMRSTLRKAIADAFESSASQITDSLTFDPKRWTLAANKQIGAMVANVNQTTKDRVRSVIANRIAAGSTIAEMQAELQKHSAFSPSRALNIARTETTRSVAAGTQEAYKAAEAEGITVRKQWLSARDGEVRPEHATLDKHAPIAVDAEFKVGGYSTMGPGQFGDPSMDCNCRCTTIPEVSGD